MAVRSRPILATAGTTLLANWVITLDPIFAGLAWAIMFGIITSTVFTLLVIPVVYWLLYQNQPPRRQVEPREEPQRKPQHFHQIQPGRGECSLVSAVARMRLEDLTGS